MKKYIVKRFEIVYNSIWMKIFEERVILFDRVDKASGENANR